MNIKDKTWLTLGRKGNIPLVFLALPSAASADKAHEPRAH